MKTEDLYKEKNDCCGCELCSQSCPRGIIKMLSDEAGFLYPKIEDETICINCKKCLSVCPMKTPGRQNHEVIRSFSFSLKDDDDLKRSASGGLATEISRKFVQAGGIVYGVEYSEDYLKVQYSRATTIDDLESFRGSKYVQASKHNLYKQIKSDLKEGRKVLFIGLPCEISAVYHAVGDKENLYTISLICHGPTSQKVHRDYCKSISKSSDKIISFMSVRYKKNGWKPYFIHVEYEDGQEYNEQFNKSDYNTAFLYLKRPSCRTCRYKAEDKQFGLLADIIAGDYHGISTSSPYYNRWGVSQGSILTEKGEFLASLLKMDYCIPEIPYNIIRTTNRGMYMAIPQRGSYDRFVRDYITKTLHSACHSAMVIYNNYLIDLTDILSRFKRIPQKIYKAFHLI